MKNSPERQLSGDALRRGVFSLPTVAVTLVAGALLFLTLFRVFNIDWGELWNNVSSIDPLMYAAALVLYYLSFWFRGIRWRLISRTAGLERSASAKVPSGLKCGAIILMGWFANSVAFLRLGDAYRGWAMSRESGAGFAPSLGTVLAERIQDMVVVLTMVLVAAAWVTVAGDVDVPGVVIIAAAGLAAAMAALLLAMRFYWKVLSVRLPHRLRRFSQRFQLSTLRSFRGRDLPLQILLGLVGWMLEIGRFYFVAQGLGIEVGFGIVMFAALANAMLTTIPTPGGFGFVEGGLTGLLILLGIDDTNALTLTVVDRSISWLSVIVFGGLVFFGWHLYRGRGRQTDNTASPAT